MKERKVSGKITALKAMTRISYKYFPELIPLIHSELSREYSRINQENRRRLQLEILKKR
jgi:hypothetical protein